MRYTLYTHALVYEALKITNVTADGDVNGTAVDLLKNQNAFRDSVLFVFQTGTITDGTYSVKLEESDNGTDWEEVPENRIQGELPEFGSDDDDAVAEVGYIPAGFRYVRVVVTAEDTSSGGTLSAVAVANGASSSPVKRA